jgi:hypothetical protein
VEDLIIFGDHLEIMTSGRAGGMKNSEPLKAD